jgi:phosphate uptake regulator
MPNESEGSLLRKVISLYLLGYGVIHVRASKGRLMSTQRQTVKETVRRHLIGTEVIADSTDGITIQILLSFPELSVENALKRMFLIAVSMHKDAIQALNEMDADVANGVIKTDDEVDRFSLYVIRQLKMAVQNTRVLKESGLTTPIDCLGYRLIVKSVERVADHASLIAKEILLIKSSLDKAIVDRIVELSNFAQGIFEESGFALFRRDYAAADRIVEKAKLATTMQSDILSTIEKSKRVHSYHTVRLIVDDTIRTVDYAGDIAEVVLNMTAEQAVVNG